MRALPTDLGVRPRHAMAALREARRRDHEALFSVVRRAFAAQIEEGDPPSSFAGATAEDIEQAMLTARAVIAETPEHGAIGACFFEAYLREVAAFRLSVVPEHRRRGVGGALLAWVEARAEEDGAEAVRIVVRTSIDENRRFYARRGYELVEPRGHHLLLEKKIARGARGGK